MNYQTQRRGAWWGKFYITFVKIDKLVYGGETNGRDDEEEEAEDDDYDVIFHKCVFFYKINK